jgi:hypothetical protein
MTAPQVPGAQQQPPAPSGMGMPVPQGSAGSAAMPTPTEPPGMTPGMLEPTPMEPGATDARYPDACAERRPSWSVPCHNNPDPCGLNSGFKGDEYCLLPPPDGEGVQIHFGPKSYTDAAEVAKYTLGPGEEINGYAIVNIPTTEEHWYQYVKLSMRPGSHHVINNIIAGHPEEGFLTGGTGCEGSSIAGFVGTQVLILESPPQGIPAPETRASAAACPPTRASARTTTATTSPTSPSSARSGTTSGSRTKRTSRNARRASGSSPVRSPVFRRARSGS